MDKPVNIYQVFNANGGWLGNTLTLEEAQAIVSQVAGAYIVTNDFIGGFPV